MMHIEFSESSTETFEGYSTCFVEKKGAGGKLQRGIWGDSWYDTFSSSERRFWMTSAHRCILHWPQAISPLCLICSPNVSYLLVGLFSLCSGGRPWKLLARRSLPIPFILPQKEIWPAHLHVYSNPSILLGWYQGKIPCIKQHTQREISFSVDVSEVFVCLFISVAIWIEARSADIPDRCSTTKPYAQTLNWLLLKINSF